MYCLVEYSYRNAATYEKRKHYHRKTTFTSLTEAGARKEFTKEKEKQQYERRFREGDDWFSYRFMDITEVRIEQH